MPIIYAIARYLGFGGCIALGLLAYYEGIPGAWRVPFLSNVPVIGDLATGKVHSYANEQVRIATAKMVTAFEYGVVVELITAERRHRLAAAHNTQYTRNRPEAGVQARPYPKTKLEKAIADDKDTDSPPWSDGDFGWLCRNGSKAPECDR
jgi:hypothetical protein